MFQKRKLNVAVASVLAASFSSGAAAKIEEVVVTATKRAQKLEDVPVAVQALTETSMSDLGVQNFSDYLVQLPGVTAGGSGPGQNTIYIRGVASTTPNLTTAGVAGLSPNVALYLDEQPLEQPGRNLDVYTADLQRVEVLSGPQGTLFGASSQAGTIRLITKKPDPSGTYANLKMGTAWTKSGDMSNNVTGVFNVPVGDKLTMRGVVFVDHRGGYIDNVRGTRDASQSARFRPAGTVRSNGVPVSAARAGFQSTSDLSGVTFLKADNSAMTQPNFNPSEYSGGRLSGLYQFNPDWNLLVEHMEQSINSEGVFYADPNLGDLQVQSFEPNKLEDYFHNTAWTLKGKLGDLETLYTGAFTRRRTDQVVDYTDYLFVGQYLPYYICDSSVTYPGSAAPSGTCQPPNLYVKSHTATKVLTSELRFNTPIENPLHATFGVFYRDMEIKERNDFTYPGSTRVDGYGVQTGFSPNYPFMTGYYSDPGPFPPGVIFRNDVKRTDKDIGVYGEATYDFTKSWALTLGARWYDIKVGLEGSANSSFCNLFQPDVNAYGTDISDLYNGDGQITYHGTCNPANMTTYTAANASSAPASVQAAINAPSKAKTDGVIGKVTLSYRPVASQMWYATWSQGFRPGLLNRPGGAQGPGGYTVPFALDTDNVDNAEIGWKLNLLNYNLRFNGSAFFVDISKLQTTIFDPSIVNLFFSDNAADAKVRGVEGDFVYTPPSVQGLTISGAFSFLHSEITRVITPTNDVHKGDSLAFAPKFQGNLRFRYTWPLKSGLTAHFMPYITYSGSSYSDVIVINRAKVHSWTMLGVTLGVQASQWSAELYIDNLTDERAELSRNFVFDTNRVTYARPRTGGVRVSYNF
ncbi:MAG TPA: TonB-dependent receptor [Pseudomonadales bacterium]|nr:TonB-dependent receptor [Pseudomonadales bacterium]